MFPFTLVPICPESPFAPVPIRFGAHSPQMPSAFAPIVYFLQSSHIPRMPICLSVHFSRCPFPSNVLIFSPNTLFPRYPFAPNLHFSQVPFCLKFPHTSIPICPGAHMFLCLFLPSIHCSKFSITPKCQFAIVFIIFPNPHLPQRSFLSNVYLPKVPIHSGLHMPQYPFPSMFICAQRLLKTPLSQTPPLLNKSKVRSFIREALLAPGRYFIKFPYDI